MPASPLGKIKMVAQVVAILALILGDVYCPGSSWSAGPRSGWWWSRRWCRRADYFRRFNGVAEHAGHRHLAVAHDSDGPQRKAGLIVVLPLPRNQQIAAVIASRVAVSRTAEVFASAEHHDRFADAASGTPGTFTSR